MKQALIIIDVQNDYFKKGKMELEHPEESLEKINRLEEKFLKLKLPIIYIQHINYKNNATFFIPNTKGVEFHDGLKVKGHSIIIEKHFPNSFKETKLLEKLKELEIEQLVISGMMTHMCIDSTTRAASELGYQPILISDATATRNLFYLDEEVSAAQVQISYLSALQNFATVETSKEFLR
ncbi:cysteine hydrolase [Lactococcus lactis subsp. lactis]|uniref:cysteine hydrolase family protein n=1 Tax=Lactococcus lactis TaxID=1358 RepID=UPI00223AEB4D|nr:cysteine hydrolase family protein [Lactococcus lactis]MCT0055567.1 cysteine hydrolase [Lactococcus lactis subsp. lactis]